jgi:glycosyltransferase involved in cell wall biosynthesis
VSKVQILIPAYNAELTLGKTIESLLAQTFKNFEILVVDNFSTDKTREIVESFKDERVHYLCNEKNLGNYGNFDKCISLARFDYTAIFHADDLYLPSILETQVKLLDNSPSIGAVFTEAIKTNSNNEETGLIRTPFWLRMRARHSVIKFNFESFLKAIIHHNCFIMAPSAIVRSKIYTNEIIRTRGEFFGNAADIDVWIRISKNWNVAVITKSLMKYRISPSQHTYLINRNRTARGEYALIANYYRKSDGHILKYSNVAIKREKIIDLILRLASLQKGSKRYEQYNWIIVKSFMNLNLFRSLRWWKYFFMYFKILLF